MLRDVLQERTRGSLVSVPLAYVGGRNNTGPVRNNQQFIRSVKPQRLFWRISANFGGSHRNSHILEQWTSSVFKDTPTQPPTRAHSHSRHLNRTDFFRTPGVALLPDPPPSSFARNLPCGHTEHVWRSPFKKYEDISICSAAGGYGDGESATMRM